MGNALYPFPFPSSVSTPPTGRGRPTDRRVDNRARLAPYIFRDLWPEEARQGKAGGRRTAG